jgi:hypothetical protein
MQIQAWQLIVGTIAGFITAFLAEPVRMYLSGLVARKQLREALYKEMAALYVNWKGFADYVSERKIPPEKLTDNVENLNLMDCYRYAKTRPIDFYSLSEAVAIDRVYKNFDLIGREGVTSFPGQRVRYLYDALKAFENHLQGGSFDQQLLLRMADARKQEILEKALGIQIT